ncbi:galactose-3-O-sulfotransferase [Nitzschia inconspicua]|uniref:Galactose-3-O-sulfotransferase n=1 Tax=Nitzschia inconspicua TaxID=303405 RepID=A0A9K3KKT9_9STRA|nr:galactose-3-O-sulfotransferase [Nitzschia inconspicua]
MKLVPIHGRLSMASGHSATHLGLATAMILFGLWRLFQQREWIALMATKAQTYDIKTTNEQSILQQLEPLDPVWWTPFVDQLARPFSILPKDPFWCVLRRIGSKASNSGMYLVKIPKTASSTATGVAIQIARSIPNRMGNRTGATKSVNGNMECTFHVTHEATHVDRQDPFLMWTLVRHPAKRVNYEFHFLSVRRIPADKNNTALIKPRYDLSSPNTTPENVLSMLQSDILESYHFIGITERLDESLVALKIILNLNMEDVIVLSSKVSGSMDDGRYDGICHKIQKSYTTPEVDLYMTEEFPLGNYDFFLYAVANRSLDLTIEAFGRELFQKEMELYYAMKQHAEEKCLSEAVFPCVEDGQPPLPEAKKSCFIACVFPTFPYVKLNFYRDIVYCYFLFCHISVSCTCSPESVAGSRAAGSIVVGRSIVLVRESSGDTLVEDGRIV